MTRGELVPPFLGALCYILRLRVAHEAQPMHARIRLLRNVLIVVWFWSRRHGGLQGDIERIT
jgi:hypothetical protein